MRRTCVIALAVWVCAAGLEAQSLTTNPNSVVGRGEQRGNPAQPEGTLITQSTDPVTITALNSVSCNAGGLHTDNSYLRRFDPDGDHALGTIFNVTAVEFGVEQAISGTGGGQPVTVNLYTIAAGDPLTFANLNLIGSSSDPAFPDQTLALNLVNVGGTVADPVATDLVVEIFTPDGQTAGNSFFVGSNPNGQIAPTYIAAADCGLPEPLDTGDIGFPDMHLVMTVFVEEVQCAEIPDDLYDGTLGSMACVTVPGDSVTIGGLDAVLAIDHTWIGDLTIKVVSPSDEVLTLMSRPGVAEDADDGSTTAGFGDSSNLISTSAISFGDRNPNDAESMGASIDGVEIVCQDDGECAFFPNPDTGPGTSFAQFIGQDATGDWRLCVGDGAQGDIGQVCLAQLNFVDEADVIFTDGFESGDTSAWTP